MNFDDQIEYSFCKHGAILPSHTDTFRSFHAESMANSKVRTSQVGADRPCDGDCRASCMEVS